MGSAPDHARGPRAALLGALTRAHGGTSTDLEAAFAPWRGRIHRRMTCRRVLDGLTVGALSGALVEVLGRLGGWSALEVAGPALTAVGAGVGWWWARQTRWDDVRTALFVDAVLGTPESVTTALTLGPMAPAPVHSMAIAALSTPRPIAPASLRRRHGWSLIGLAFVVGLIAAPHRGVSRAAEPPGTDIVQLSRVPGLDRIAEVERLPARDASQKDRLAKIAEQARELKRRLLEGAPRREALDRLRELKQQLDAERRDFARGENALGLSAAASALRSGGFPGLADALEQGDLQSFDAMMERLANDREASDREKARAALDQALEAAKQRGAKDLADALERQKKHLDDRADKADVLRELADALKGMPGDPGTRSFDDSATDSAGRDLADSLRKGLEKLSPEERKRLADRLKAKADRGGSHGKASPRAREQLKDLARRLQTPEGQRELDEQLKDLSRPNDRDGADPDEQRDQGLGDAEDGADETGRGLRPNEDGTPGGRGQGRGDAHNDRGKPGNGSGSNPGRGQGQGQGQGQGSDGDLGLSLGGGGPSRGGGPGDHQGHTKRVDAESFKARARGKGHDLGQPLPGGSRVTSPGTDGAKATVGKTGDLSGTSAEELRGVEHAEIPEAVRRQVRAYFE